ncbi:MAG: hypothetical protein JO250_01630 [Armatimonadetes bacterium]|nr:hypothetical protein [Armatimonadota bacterium]
MQRHTPVIVLSDPAGRARVAVAPAYEGRVMTSTAGGPGGDSFGWINRALIASGRTGPHINAYGGEDRIWFGPEGGQFGLFFPPGAPFDFAHWQTPAPVDTQPWPVTVRTRGSLTFAKTLTLTNHSGTRFRVRVRRTVRLLTPGDVRRVLGAAPPPAVRAVGYETDNRMTNAGRAPWRPRTGLLSIWILGQYIPSPVGAIVIPFRPGPVATMGKIVNDAYFGKVPGGRLRIDAARGVLFFKDDGKKRGKIGIGPRRVKDTLGSYDPARQVLTVVRFGLPPGPARYVNSMWEIQRDPYGGDVANAYNDGPLATGGHLGPFYELESSSPSGALSPGRSLEHRRATIHLQGPPAALDPLAVRLLGVHLADVTQAFSTGE